MIRPLATICAVFAAAAVIACAAAASSAQAQYLTSTAATPDHHLNILRWPPRNPSFRPCIYGTANLRADYYVHGAYIVSEKHRDKPDLYQAHIRPPVAGKYAWEVCRGWNPAITGVYHDQAYSGYQVRSTVKGHGWSHTILNTFEHNLYGDGNYEWGGRIAMEPPAPTHPAE
jgi:hypothetical protein